MTQEQPELPDKVLRIQPSPESIERLNRSVAAFASQMRRWSFGLKARAAFGALLDEGNDETAYALLDQFDAEQLQRVQDAAAALSLAASRRLIGERDEGQAAALDKAWLATVRAEGLDRAAEVLAGGGGPRCLPGRRPEWWDDRDREYAVSRLCLEAARMRREAEGLRASAERPAQDEGAGS